jgi:hypothetical protein
MSARLEWEGEKVADVALRASLAGIDETTERTAAHARANHPGWKSVTGEAERSIHTERAQMTSDGPKGLVGGGVPYFIWLELKRGSALRHAADVTFRGLGDAIAEQFRRLAPRR